MVNIYYTILICTRLQDDGSVVIGMVVVVGGVVLRVDFFLNL